MTYPYIEYHWVNCSCERCFERRNQEEIERRANLLDKIADTARKRFEYELDRAKQEKENKMSRNAITPELVHTWDVDGKRHRLVRFRRWGGEKDKFVIDRCDRGTMGEEKWVTTYESTNEVEGATETLASRQLAIAIAQLRIDLDHLNRKYTAVLANLPDEKDRAHP